MKIKKLISSLLVSSLIIMPSINANAAHFPYRLNGGVGNYGNNPRYYYVSNPGGIAQSHVLAFDTAMNKWVNSNGGLTYTPISYKKTSVQKNSDLDVYYDNYGKTGYYGVTIYMLYQTQLVPEGAAPNQNWGWNKIKMNSYPYVGGKPFYVSSQGSVGEHVASHEIGHCFGLAHTSNRNSVMYDNWPQPIAPNKADLDEVTSMY
ncbi:matrixin family metalloprotease [Clostridium sp.]|uniref:matrixin family metalloprotease n=1 Tax=Clostridium sp. TaxID=1506 RepID=UPI0025C49AA9|nr:matrixin family metalloprotease [Clostridium sp.]MCI9304382.1 matrixin family metalloprotease [Clostridium sp.]